MKAQYLLPALAGFLLAQHAQAQTVQGATFFAAISTSPYDPAGGTPISYSVNNGQYNESASALASPVPQISVAATSTDTHVTSGAQAFMTYDFMIQSSGQAGIVVDIQALAQAAGYGHFNAEAHVDLEGGGAVSLANAFACNDVAGCNPFNQVPEDGRTSVVYLFPNRDYQIFMEANVYLSDFNSAATAYADPIITFDPNYSHPDDAKIIYSANLPMASTSLVPEPASWALMLGGFGAVGGALRRKKRADAHCA